MFEASGWQPVETAPRDGKTVYAENWQTGQRGLVHFNGQGEWELVDGLSNTPMGKGFYPTHWMHLPAPPKPVRDPLAYRLDGTQNWQA